METFTKFRPLVANPDFARQRSEALASLDLTQVDEPLRELVAALNGRDDCFTLQCCWGHFLPPGAEDERSLTAPPPRGKGELEYRVAYVALALRDDAGEWLETLRGLRDAEPRFVQFGCAEWFWERQVDSYVLQVGLKKYRRRDRMTLDGKQARLISHARTRLFRELATVTRGEVVQ